MRVCLSRGGGSKNGLVSFFSMRVEFWPESQGFGDCFLRIAGSPLSPLASHYEIDVPCLGQRCGLGSPAFG